MTRSTACQTRSGERPNAFVLCRPGAVVSEAELIAYLKAQVARFTVPKAIELVDYLPRTSTGKLQRIAIREKEWAGAKQTHPGGRRIL